MSLTLLLAQSSGNDPSTAIGIASAIAAFVAFLLIAAAIYLAIAVGIAYMLWLCLNRVPPEHRQMEPGYVFLMLIPFFGLYWNFRVAEAISRSFQSYFGAQGVADVGDCGYGVGKWFAISAVCSLVPCINYIAMPASVVLLIIFLVKSMSLRARIPEVE